MFTAILSRMYRVPRSSLPPHIHGGGYACIHGPYLLNSIGSIPHGDGHSKGRARVEPSKVLSLALRVVLEKNKIELIKRETR